MLDAKPHRRRRGWGQSLPLFLSIALAASCGGSLYKVKPTVDSPVSTGSATTTTGGIHLRAAPLLTDEETQELFEANLLLAGLLPVRVELSNESGATLEFKRVRFHLREGPGAEWKYRTPKQAVSRILEANDIFLYNPNSRAAFETSFGAHALDLQTPLAPNQSRRGLIFFQTPKKEAVESPRSLVLTIEGLPQPLELRLN
jgi:hypothetical protein